MYRKVTCVQSRHPWRPMQGQISGSEGKTKRADKKTGRRVLLPVLYFSACSFPRPFKLSLALGLFKGSHEDVCQWTVVFILSVLNWGYIISRQSWKSEGNVCTIELIYLKPSRSPGHPKGSPVPKYWSNNSLWGSVMPRIRIVRSFKLDCIISVIKEITRKH